MTKPAPLVKPQPQTAFYPVQKIALIADQTNPVDNANSDTHPSKLLAFNVTKNVLFVIKMIALNAYFVKWV